MAFFVEESSKSSQDDPDSDDLEIEIIAIGKRTGLSFAEMNELRVKDLLKYARKYTGAKDDSRRMATQADIDSFYAS